MAFKIKEIPREGQPLCRNCTHVHMQTGFKESEEQLFCYYGPLRRLPFPVKECTDFAHKLSNSLDDMWQMALTIPAEPARRPSGFVSRIGFRSGEDQDETEDETVAAQTPEV